MVLSHVAESAMMPNLITVAETCVEVTVSRPRLPDVDLNQVNMVTHWFNVDDRNISVMLSSRI